MNEADSYLTQLVADALAEPPPDRFGAEWARRRELVDAALAWADLEAACSVEEIVAVGDRIRGAVGELRKTEAPEVDVDEQCPVCGIHWSELDGG